MFASMGAVSLSRGDHREWLAVIAHTVADGVASVSHDQEQWAAQESGAIFPLGMTSPEVALSILQEVALLESHPLAIILYVRDAYTGKGQRKRCD